MRFEAILLSVAVLLLVETNAKPGTRIIGGQDAAAGEFPYAAAITVQTEDTRHFCGGTLMRNQWVLTSATCVNNAVLFTIQLGSNTLTAEDPNRVTVASSEYVIHPDFDPETLQADIGLIKLRMNVSFTDFLQNANFLVATIPDATPVLIIGWGQTSDSEAGLSDHLQYVQASALLNPECKVIYGDQITDNMVCVEGNYNEGTCTGDNGGPLLQKSGMRYLVVGVASFISANGCESTNPSGYTRISPYFVWIRNTMNGVE